MSRVMKLLVLLLSVLMILAVVPLSSLAQEASETRKLAKLKKAWSTMSDVESEMLELKATACETAEALYIAALNTPLIDKGSIVWESEDQFAFTVDGMHCVYSYSSRNGHTFSETSPALDEINTDMTRSGSGGPSSNTVLYICPMVDIEGGGINFYDIGYTHESGDQAYAVSQAINGSFRALLGTDATAPLVASWIGNSGVIIVDSSQMVTGSSSYIELTTDEGITSDDYLNGWAVYGYEVDVSGATLVLTYIDGRYIQNHANGPLKNSFVWMGCGIMSKTGKGTTGNALLAAGAGCVFGFSECLDRCRYKYGEVFWHEMINGATVAEAFDSTAAAMEYYEPFSSCGAYPIVMSASDPFPDDPNSHQSVNCDWVLFANDPVNVNSFRIVDDHGIDIEQSAVVQGTSLNLKLKTTPVNANRYSVEWTVSNGNASIEPSADGRSCKVNGICVGSASVTAVLTTTAGTVMSDTVDVEVKKSVRWEPTDELTNEGEYLIGFADNDVIYLAVSYSPFNADHYCYFSVICEASLGFTAPAFMSGQAVIGVHGNAEDLLHCSWTVEINDDGYVFRSVYQPEYVLSSYANVNYYGDLCPAAERGRISTWQWDPVNKTLSLEEEHWNGSTTYYYAQHWREGLHEVMGINYSVPENRYVQFFRKVDTGMPGDVNGDGVVDSADITLAAAYAMSAGSVSAQGVINGDMNGDGVLTAADLSALYSFIQG